MRELLEAAAGRSVSRETVDRLEGYVALLVEEAQVQNLVGRSTLDDIWYRHIADAAQLIRFVPHENASWLDVGSGAGLPGVVLACMISGPVTLVEPRRLRAEFLHKVCARLGLEARVACMKVELVEGKFDALTARAVAPLGKLLKISHHLSTRNTVWVLPRGKNAPEELAGAQRTWHGTFHVERSVTDVDSFIVVATGVRSKS
jgi:16S rRNA (guanine527-N7)-methyltransferase